MWTNDGTTSNSEESKYRWYFKNIYLVSSEAHGPYNSYDEAYAAGQAFDKENDLPDNGLEIWCHS